MGSQPALNRVLAKGFGGTPNTNKSFETKSVESNQSGSTTRSELVAKMEEFIRVRLTELQQMNEETLKILTSVMPTTPIVTRESTMTKSLQYGVNAMEFVTPFAKNGYISVKDWWEELNRQLGDNGLSIKMRFIVISRTGGLPEKGYELQRKKVRNFMRPSEICEWLPEFDSSHDESDMEHWLQMWLELGLKLIVEFFVFQDENTIEEGLENLFKEKDYKIQNHVDEALNTEFHKAFQLLKNAFQFLKDRGSQWTNSPATVVKRVRDWLKLKQGPIGVQMEQCITKALQVVVQEPLKALPPGHRLTTQELQEIVNKGASRITEKVYMLVFRQLHLKAQKKELSLDIKNHTQLAQLYDISVPAEKRVAKKAVNNVNVKTDWNEKPKTTDKDKDKESKCPKCNMFCAGDQRKGLCNYWDQDKKMFKIKGFLGVSKNRWIGPDGRQYLGNNAFRRLQQFPTHGYHPIEGYREDSQRPSGSC